MTRTFVIHPNYQKLEHFISFLPENFLNQGEYIHDGRNKIKMFDVDGLKINVKRYRIPLIFNRLIYVYLRQPKAVRAYDYALKLLEAGVNTPAPIAYILERKNGLLGFSYFLSVQVPYSRRFYEFGNSPMDEEHRMILEAFGHYTATLHNKEIYHQDYSPGNILFDVIDGKPEFCLVDINRMEFGPVSMKKGCLNFARLWGPLQMFRIIAKAYAQTRGFNEEETCREILQAREQYWRKISRKRKPEFPLEF